MSRYPGHFRKPIAVDAPYSRMSRLPPKKRATAFEPACASGTTVIEVPKAGAKAAAVMRAERMEFPPAQLRDVIRCHVAPHIPLDLPKVDMDLHGAVRAATVDQLCSRVFEIASGSLIARGYQYASTEGPLHRVVITPTSRKRPATALPPISLPSIRPLLIQRIVDADISIRRPTRAQPARPRTMNASDAQPWTVQVVIHTENVDWHILIVPTCITEFLPVLMAAPPTQQ